MISETIVFENGPPRKISKVLLWVILGMTFIPDIAITIFLVITEGLEDDFTRMCLLALGLGTAATVRIFRIVAYGTRNHILRIVVRDHGFDITPHVGEAYFVDFGGIERIDRSWLGRLSGFKVIADRKEDGTVWYRLENTVLQASSKLPKFMTNSMDEMTSRLSGGRASKNPWGDIFGFRIHAPARGTIVLHYNFKEVMALLNLLVDRCSRASVRLK